MAKADLKEQLLNRLHEKTNFMSLSDFNYLIELRALKNIFSIGRKFDVHSSNSNKLRSR